MNEIYIAQTTQHVHIHFTQILQLAYQDDNKYVYYKKNKGD